MYNKIGNSLKHLLEAFMIWKIAEWVLVVSGTLAIPLLYVLVSGVLPLFFGVFVLNKFLFKL
jgi:hypothetical protein